ncbi:MAG: hypothetical protein RI894_1459 [Bacteroidota bacterium]
MLAVHGFYENGQVRLNHIPPTKKGVMRVIVTFLEEENDTDSALNTTAYATHIATINSFSILKPNWDSYNADVITPKSIVLATELLADLYQKNRPIEGIFPMRNGGVQIEFSKETQEIELEIFDDTISFLVYENSILLENKSFYNLKITAISKLL